MKFSRTLAVSSGLCTVFTLSACGEPVLASVTPNPDSCSFTVHISTKLDTPASGVYAWWIDVEDNEAKHGQLNGGGLSTDVTVSARTNATKTHIVVYRKVGRSRHETYYNDSPANSAACK